MEEKNIFFLKNNKIRNRKVKFRKCKDQRDMENLEMIITWK